VVLVYDGSILTLTMEDQTTNATFSQPFRVNIPGLLGGQTGYAGFTASTGLKTAVQSILDWQLVSSDCCMTGVPAFPSGFSAASDLKICTMTFTKPWLFRALGGPNPLRRRRLEEPLELAICPAPANVTSMLAADQQRTRRRERVPL
jgi:hypothetical protein